MLVGLGVKVFYHQCNYMRPYVLGIVVREGTRQSEKALPVVLDSHGARKQEKERREK